MGPMEVARSLVFGDQIMKTAAEKTATAASTPAPKPANAPFFSKVTGTTPTVPAAQSSQKLRGVSAMALRMR